MAEELGLRTARALTGFADWLARSIDSGLDIAARSTHSPAARLRIAWKKAIEFSGVLEPPSRHHAARKPRVAVVPPTASAPAPGPAIAVSHASVGVVEYSANRESLLEVSMLERLGFYNEHTSVVVAISPSPTATATLPRPRPQGPAQGPESIRRHMNEGASLRSGLIPDLELDGWKPRVIARSKLGPGSFRLTTASMIALAALVVVALAVAVIRRPQVETTRFREGVTTQVAALSVALLDLQEALASAEASDAGATSALVQVDQAARALFDAASQLDATMDGQLRESTTGIASAALDLENRVTEALSYRLVLGPLWHIPDLEGVTDATTAAASLAPWQARINDLTSSLPENADLGAHAATVSTFVREVEPWASAYLDALAIGDAALAEASLAGLEARLAGIAHSAEAAISDVVADAEAESGILIGQLATLGGGNAGT